MIEFLLSIKVLLVALKISKSPLREKAFGTLLGTVVGTFVGTLVGTVVGTLVGTVVGTLVGTLVNTLNGTLVGTLVCIVKEDAIESHVDFVLGNVFEL